MNTPQGPLPADFPYHSIMLDRSKPFSTIHGERLADDPHCKVAAMQNGLPFDVNDRLVPDDGQTQRWNGIAADGKSVIYMPLYTSDMRMIAMRRLDRIKKGKVQVEPEEEVRDPSETVNTDDINLSTWLTGQEDYKDHEIVAAVAQRFGRKLPGGIKGRQMAVFFLVYEEGGPGLVHQQNVDGSLVQLASPLVEAAGR